MKYHNDRVEVWAGDCRDVLAGFDPDTFGWMTGWRLGPAASFWI